MVVFYVLWLVVGAYWSCLQPVAVVLHLIYAKANIQACCFIKANGSLPLSFKCCSHWLNASRRLTLLAFFCLFVGQWHIRGAVDAIVERDRRGWVIKLSSSSWAVQRVKNVCGISEEVQVSNVWATGRHRPLCGDLWPSFSSKDFSPQHCRKTKGGCWN